jgi:dienelactone hydrolase
MKTRRDFLQALLAGASAAAQSHKKLSTVASATLERGEPESLHARTGSDVGSLYSFVQSQATHGAFPFSYLQPEFQEVTAWKQRARERLLDLLHYSPPPANPRPEVLERVDKGAYIREKILFNTTPDLRVPAHVLIPTGQQGRVPAVVALHDHGGFYLWGKEKIIGVEDEHPSLTEFKKRAYDGKSIASELATQGYVVIAIDMFYWGERRMILDDDPEDWRFRPRSMSAGRVAAFNKRASQSEPLVGRMSYAAGFTWSDVMFWDDVRTVDYLVSRPDVDPDRVG